MASFWHNCALGQNPIMGNIFAPLSIGAKPDIGLGIWGVPPNILVVAQNLILGVHLVLETGAPIKLNFKYHTYNACMAVCSVAVFFVITHLLSVCSLPLASACAYFRPCQATTPKNRTLKRSLALDK